MSFFPFNIVTLSYDLALYDLASNSLRMSAICHLYTVIVKTARIEAQSMPVLWRAVTYSHVVWHGLE
jgi:hypothetical protein